VFAIRKGRSQSTVNRTQTTVMFYSFYKLNSLKYEINKLILNTLLIFIAIQHTIYETKQKAKLFIFKSSIIPYNVENIKTSLLYLIPQFSYSSYNNIVLL